MMDRLIDRLCWYWDRWQTRRFLRALYATSYRMEIHGQSVQWAADSLQEDFPSLARSQVYAILERKVMESILIDGVFPVRPLR